MNQSWFEDILSQTYNEEICYNPTKLLILYYISKDNVISEKYSKICVLEYIYQVFIDNPVIAMSHPNYIIRSIGKYGLKDIVGILEDALESWKKDAPNGTLKYNAEYLVLDMNLENSEEIAMKTQSLCEKIYRKVFKGILPKPKNIVSEMCNLNDQDIEIFGQSVFRNRVLEDMQYCPICECIDLNELVAIHIIDSTMNMTITESIDKNNGLIMCKKHAQSFISHKFFFDERGYVVNLSCNDIEIGAHLSFSVRTPKRKAYLKRRSVLDENNYI